MKGITCQDLLAHVPDELLESLEEKTKVNHQVKKLSGKLLFKLFLYTLLNSERASLRVMEAFYNSAQFKAFSGSSDQRPIRHSGIAERMIHIDSDFFKSIFDCLLERFSSALNQKKSGMPLDLTIVDSTLVSLSARLLKIGMEGLGKNRGNKKQIKFTMAIHNGLPSEVKLFTEQSDLSEERALKRLILESSGKEESVFIFDRGLQRRKTFVEFNEKKVLFITRLKDRVRYRKVRPHKIVSGRKTKTLSLKEDLIIQFKDETEKFMSEEFRMITAISLETGEEIKFLTNITDLKASQITDIYKERWLIEMFFRFIKQELNFKHFFSRTENGIKVMLYMTLILALLLLVYKSKNRISGYKHSKLRFALELEMEIIKEIVLACGGDVSKLKPLQNSHPPWF